MPKIAYLNSKYINFNKAKIHIEDRGLQFSDSVYEVVPFYNKKRRSLHDYLTQTYIMTADDNYDR